MSPFYEAVHRLGQAITQLNNKDSRSSMRIRAEVCAARYVKLVEILKAEAEAKKPAAEEKTA